jgi:hypothetical protein
VCRTSFNFGLPESSNAHNSIVHAALPPIQRCRLLLSTTMLLLAKGDAILGIAIRLFANVAGLEVELPSNVEFPVIELKVPFWFGRGCVAAPVEFVLAGFGAAAGFGF